MDDRIFKVDHNYKQEIAPIVAQLEQIEPASLENVKRAFNNDQPEEFYEGLLSGYVGVISLLEQVPIAEAINFCKIVTAILAQKLNNPKDKLPEWIQKG